MLTADGSTGSRFSSPVVSAKTTRYLGYILAEQMGISIVEMFYLGYIRPIERFLPLVTVSFNAYRTNL